MALTDLEIAQQATYAPLDDVARQAGLDPSFLEPYGDHVAKIRLDALDRPAT